jgi:hypothetical protein
LPDFQTKFAPVASALEGATARGVLWQTARGRFLLDVPDVARYLVSDGAVITIDHAPDAHDEEVTRFLRMTPLAALLFQRGSLAFHAAALSPPSLPQQDMDWADETGAILIAGDSGAGKSTLLAALLQRGWRLLADDLAVVDMDADGRLVVLPAFPEIVLWQDAVEKLGLGAATRKAFPNSSGLSVLTSQLATAPQPLRAIYWLSIHHKDEIEMSELKGAERFRAIGTLTYNSHIADALLDLAMYLRRASAIAQTIPLRRLRRPRGQWSVAELADKIVIASETLRFGQSDKPSQ